MTASEIRAKARKSLDGKWGKSALSTLIFVVFLWIVNFIVSFISSTFPILAVLINVVWIVIATPISFGMLTTFIKFKREKNEEVKYTDFIQTAFSNFGKVWNVFGNILLKMLPLIIGIIIGCFLIIFGIALIVLSFNYSFIITIGALIYFVCIVLLIPKSFLYSLSYAILYDNPHMCGIDIVEKSEQLMKNNRWKLFCLYLSFIGWALLCIFSLGIGYLWLIPYIMISFVAFYDSLIDTELNDKELSNTTLANTEFDNNILSTDVTTAKLDDTTLEDTSLTDN